MFIDLSPLIQSRNFRYLYIGQFISMFGTMLTYVALPYQIYQLTHSSLAVGLMGIVELIPLLVTSLWGGALADQVDRRKLLLLAELILMINCVFLLLNSLLPTPSVLFVYCAAAIGSACNGFHRPTLEAITPTIVAREKIPAVSALTSLKFTISMIVGPALAGIVMSGYGVSMVFSLDILSYMISLVAIYLIDVPLVLVKATESVTRSILSGLRYAGSRQELIGTYAVDIIAMIFGMPQALFPAISEQFGGATVLGWFYSAPAIGALVVTVFGGWMNKIKRYGLGVAIAASIWGLAIIIFGFASSVYVAIAALMLAGGADAVSGVFRVTLWNLTIPTELRGRLAGIEMLSYMSGPLLGNAEAGLVAAAFGVTFSVVSGGVFCIVGVALATLALPKFLSYHAGQSEK